MRLPPSWYQVPGTWYHGSTLGPKGPAWALRFRATRFQGNEVFTNFEGPYLEITRFHEKIKVARRPYDKFPAGVAARSLLCVGKRRIVFSSKSGVLLLLGPMGRQRPPKHLQGSPKCRQGTQEIPKGAQRESKVSPRDPNRPPKEAKGSPKIPPGAPKSTKSPLLGT